jgi:hypothetical protein
MIPYLQIDEQDASLYLTDANSLVNLNLNYTNYRFDTKTNSNKQLFPLFPMNCDIKGFIKKDSILFSYSK